MKRKGFTLIELLAVILILGIIALIAIPTVNKLIKESRMGSWATAGTNMVKAAETWYQSEQLKGKYENQTTPVTIKGSEGITDDTSLKTAIGLKGKVPAYGNIEVFTISTDGTATLSFWADQFACTNSSTEYKPTGFSGVTGDGSGTAVKCISK